MASALISSITSALKIVDRLSGTHSLRIVLMNLKALLACSRMLGDDDDGRGWQKDVKERLLCSTVLGDEVDGSKSLLPRIQDAIERIEFRRERFRKKGERYQVSKIAIELHMLAKEVEDRVAKQLSSCGRPPMVYKLNSVLDFTYEFLAFVRLTLVTTEAVEALEVQITFLKNFLVFAKRTYIFVRECVYQNDY